LATVFPFFANSRGAFVLVPITALLIWHYMRRPLSLKTLLLAVVVAALAVTTLSAFRLGFDNLSELRPYLTGQKALELIVGNRNFFGVAKTAHIIDAVPERLDYQYGKTLVLWLAAPVPRTLWKEKPVISTGQIIGEEVFGSGIGASGGGVPPGFVAEMYWNFGFLGVFLGMFLLGYWLRAIYQCTFPYLSTYKSALLIYIAIMIPFAFGLLGASVSAAILEAAANVIPIFLALLFITQRKGLRHAR
jgi:oligosaccharide repeat unit polymerase